ncbi:Malate dehydrogenase, mitochondrial [Tetrabaena socialis]|uniref:Malate dehydrogenase, mitochondrial n=1 Tax=Tetrabaena socialis TaxID=47790 RepID=A0A2J7ZTC8_9CHLO|nr:Malate dehydrogenase, mitochondrial [Tetrabaena socialis]|eukprot:PNH03490.1 Malate dehydrogenase, mitochondrial [Tetrabaena socialis]
MRPLVQRPRNRLACCHAYAAARMAESTLLGLNGEPNIYECAFVQSEVVSEVPFFATKVLLGPNGVAKVMGLGEMDAFETAALAAMLPQLKGEIQKGLDFTAAPKA